MDEWIYVYREFLLRLPGLVGYELIMIACGFLRWVNLMARDVVCGSGSWGTAGSVVWELWFLLLH